MDGRNKHWAKASNELVAPSPWDLDYDVMIRKQLEVPHANDQRLWDPDTMLSNLSVMEEKIHQLQELVRLTATKSSKDRQLVQQQQQLVTADLTSIIIQLISTAGSLLPSVNPPHFPANPNPVLDPDPNLNANPSFVDGVNVSDSDNNNNNNYASDTNMVSKVEDHLDDDADEGENLPPGSYEILQLEKEEILAPHTHFCLICGKGFKRDANLRMHMRGHGDEYKTPAALAKPHKETTKQLIKRYSCPFVGCKRNKDHKKFQPLKTILCVKNHYKRSHCDKSYTCSRCNTKKFSVIADLKTHEKHCGRDRWLCSCGTTFSRKDKLFGHISLFQGHTPAIEPNPPDPDPDPQGFGLYDFNSSACLSPFPRSLFEDSDSLSFLGTCMWKNGGESSSKDLQ